MAIMKITILGLEMALKPENKSVFDLMNLPTGIDKDTLTDNIILEGGDFEVLYADPYMFRAAVGTWTSKHYRTFEKWVNALNLEYNPLENYDRMEDYSDTSNKGSKTSSSGTNGNTRTLNYEDKETLNTKNTDEHTVSAFDSGSYQPSDKNVVDNTGTDTYNHTGTITDSGNESSSGSLTENGKTIHEGRIHGNIGVTTSQQMLQSEIDIARFNLIQEITDLFLTEFMIMIYD